MLTLGGKLRDFVERAATDRKKSRERWCFSARAAPSDAGAVVTLRETRRMFRSSLLRSPARAASSPWPPMSSGWARTKPACWAASSLLNQTSATVRL